MAATEPCVIILAAPSGSGKTSLAKRLLEYFPGAFFSVSATTRPPRDHERSGVHYNFISAEAFRDAISAGELLEYEEVYPDCFYGTLRSEVERSSPQTPILLDIDVIGATKVKAEYGDRCLALFVKAPSLAELEKRLIDRGTETDQSLQIRIEKASLELTFADEFDHVIVNDRLNRAAEEMIQVVKAFLDSL